VHSLPQAKALVRIPNTPLAAGGSLACLQSLSRDEKGTPRHPAGQYASHRGRQTMICEGEVVMTDEELRDLDAEIHEKVMGGPVRRDAQGLPWIAFGTDWTGFSEAQPPRPYSTESAWALAAAEAFDCFGYSLTKGERYHASFLDGEPEDHSDPELGSASASADTLPLAICLALRKGVRRQARAREEMCHK
jgi:hypothetical protein